MQWPASLGEYWTENSESKNWFKSVEGKSEREDGVVGRNGRYWSKIDRKMAESVGNGRNGPRNGRCRSNIGPKKLKRVSRWLQIQEMDCKWLWKSVENLTGVDWIRPGGKRKANSKQTRCKLDANLMVKLMAKLATLERNDAKIDRLNLESTLDHHRVKWWENGGRMARLMNLDETSTTPGEIQLMKSFLFISLQHLSL